MFPAPVAVVSAVAGRALLDRPADVLQIGQLYRRPPVATFAGPEPFTTVSVNQHGDIATTGVIKADNVGRVTFTNRDKGESVRVPEEILIKYCADLDGCQLRFAMTNWDSNAVAKGKIASNDGTFFYNPQTGYFRSGGNIGERYGTVGDDDGKWGARAWSCALSDHMRISNAVQNDDVDDRDMFLLNVIGSGHGYFNGPGQTCSLTIID